MNETITLITRDERLLAKMQSACREIRVTLETFADLKQAAASLDATPDLVLCDHQTFMELHPHWPRLSVLLYAEPTDSEQVIESIKLGALDYLIRPISPKDLLEHLRKSLRISRDIHRPPHYDERDVDTAADHIVGQSPAMKEVYKRIGLIAPRDINVLITGESGTGKELVARALLHHSPRKNKPYLAVNCAAIPETLLESELFGHEKGAFTGAVSRRIGKFEQCHNGTLFLDEIGDIPPATQAKLLRVLQDGSFQRLGGTATIEVDVRIIAATHQRLEEMIEQRRFRQDLYFRLMVAAIEVPPLRDREVDSVLLAHYFVNRFNAQFGTQIQSFAPEVLPLLLNYSWPGNVRELENVIKSALVVARGNIFRPEFLPEHVRNAPRRIPVPGGTPAVSGSPTAPDNDAAPHVDTMRPSPAAAHPPAPQPQSRASDAPPGPSAPLDTPDTAARTLAEHLAQNAPANGDLYRQSVTIIEREVIRAALHRTAGQYSHAARMLGISRTTLNRKMRDLGITVQASVSIDPQSID